MNGTLELATIIEAVTDKTLDYALLLAAIGTLSMAIVELLKGITRFRCRFHRRMLARWMIDFNCRRELMVLAAGGEQNANVLFDQPTERMMGQIQAAANMALDYPDRYPHTYKFFSQEDLQMMSLQPGGLPRDSELWERFATGMAHSGQRAIEAQQESESRAAQQARVRIGNLIARRLDMFQNSMLYLWARINQVLSIAVGSGLSAYVLLTATRSESTNDFIVLVLMSFTAGMLAPFAKDVVSAIGGLRAKA
ncbi:MAG TPA: hypothetical protein PLU16_02535 [Gallionellaceae bacterium]|nr:hypothetical protein [Gallionellaceae bacterium]HQS74059.1 hypothetical protein [Gallionellaceae bacterium]